MSEITLKSFSELTKEDFYTFYTIRYSDYVHKYFGGKKPSLESHYEWVQSKSVSSDYKGFGIILDKKVIGGCSLKYISKLNSNAEFDIFLSGKMSGKGYGKSAMKKLISFGFDELNLNRIYAFYLGSNDKARTLYADLGFKKEGLLRENVYKNGQYYNSIVIGLLRKEYEHNN